MTTTPIGRSAELQGRYTPVPDEIDAVDLPVEGALPPELTGRYVRNGPNPLPGEESGHLFTGHGMLHGVRLRDGRAEWYRNRWVRTGALEGRPFLSEAGVDLTAVPANTHVIEHGGRLFALVENGSRPEQRGVTGTLGDLPDTARAHDIASPALLILGEVAALATHLHWFGAAPLGPPVAEPALARAA